VPLHSNLTSDMRRFSAITKKTWQNATPINSTWGAASPTPFFNPLDISRRLVSYKTHPSCRGGVYVSYLIHYLYRVGGITNCKTWGKYRRTINMPKQFRGTLLIHGHDSSVPFSIFHHAFITRLWHTWKPPGARSRTSGSDLSSRSVCVFFSRCRPHRWRASYELVDYKWARSL
jgi:hypothetical protein